MLNLNQVNQLKECFGTPYRYIGANFNKVQLEYGRIFWYMTCVESLSGAIKNVDSILEGKKAALKSFGDLYCPYPSSYRPEYDVTNELDADLINKLQQTIGVIRWSIDLGRIYIMVEVSFLSRHLCSPHEGNLNSFCNISR